MQEKLVEALKAVLPIVLIVLLLSFTFLPMPTSILPAFLFGGLLIAIRLLGVVYLLKDKRQIRKAPAAALADDPNAIIEL